MYEIENTYLFDLFSAARSELLQVPEKLLVGSVLCKLVFRGPLVLYGRLWAAEHLVRSHFLGYQPEGDRPVKLADLLAVPVKDHGSFLHGSEHLLFAGEIHVDVCYPS